MTNPYTLLGASLCILFLTGGSANAAPTIEIVAVSGDAAPDGNGEFATHTAGFPSISAFEYPALGDNGKAAFRAYLTNTTGGGLDDTGVYVGDGTTLTQVSRAGQSAAGDGIFNNYNSVKLNDTGVATFVGFLGGTSAGNGNNAGVYFGNGVSLTEVIREGDAAPDADGTFSDNFNTSPGINEAGQIAFRAQLNGTTSGSSNDTGVFLYSGGTLTQVVREGDAAPDADGTFANLTSPPAINDAGQLAFYANMTGPNNQAILFYNGTTVTQVARTGQAAPDADGSFDAFTSGAALNNSGQVGFSATLTGTSADRGVFLGNDTALTQIVRAGDVAPDLNGTFDFVGGPAINDAGQAVFFGSLTGTTAGADDDTGLFRGSGGAITSIMREGQSAAGNGAFGELVTFALNDSGQVAFLAQLTGTTGGSGDDEGIFLFDDDLGLIEIVRNGDALLGSTINRLVFSGGSTFDDDERSGLNGLGQVAYYFGLADGRNGVAIATIPELSTPLPGDLNGDGFVGIADLNIVLGNWNQNVTTGDKLFGDPSGDGFVGIADLNTVLGNWNAGTPPPEVLARVPEPCALFLMALNGFLLCIKRR